MREEKIPEGLSPERMPAHVAIVMDGNGRWAEERGLLRVQGHQAGAKAVRRTVTASREMGLRFLTLYAFSTENWLRPESEVGRLMELLDEYLKEEIEEMRENSIRLNAVGRLADLPPAVKESLERTMALTAGGDRMLLTLCLSYSGRAEMVDAVRSIVARAVRGELDPEKIDAAEISRSLYTAGMPDPDLIIRTSGELRLSNFLTWQSAYSELYFTGKYWPDFGPEDLVAAIADYQKRERRFGKTGAQVKGQEG